MTVRQIAQSGYGAARASIATPRDVEAALLGRVTSELERVASSDAQPADTCTVLTKNLQVWQAFQSDVFAEKNRLPEDLKTQIGQLVDFVFAHTDRVLRKEGEIEALISVNRAIVSGLRREVEQVA